MTRLTGFLALFLSTTIIALLAHRTESAEFSGSVSAPPPDLSGFPPPSPEFTWILQRREPTDSELEVLARAADRVHGRGGSTSNGPFVGYYSARFPAAVARASVIGDELVIRESRTHLFGSVLERRSFELSGSSGTSRVGAPDNASFLLVWGLLSGGPIALWAVAAGISAFRGR